MYSGNPPPSTPPPPPQWIVFPRCICIRLNSRFKTCFDDFSVVSQKVGDLTLVSVSTEGAKIKWSGVDGATGYRVSISFQD